MIIKHLNSKLGTKQGPNEFTMMMHGFGVRNEWGTTLLHSFEKENLFRMLEEKN